MRVNILVPARIFSRLFLNTLRMSTPHDVALVTLMRGMSSWAKYWKYKTMRRKKKNRQARSCEKTRQYHRVTYTRTIYNLHLCWIPYSPASFISRTLSFFKIISMTWWVVRLDLHIFKTIVPVHNNMNEKETNSIFETVYFIKKHNHLIILAS